MKIGSLIECIQTGTGYKWVTKPTPPVVGATYTLKEIIQCPVTKKTCIRIEEFPFGYNDAGVELAANIDWFRELQPPMDLSFINELQQPKVLACNGSEGAE